ncbi:MAG: TIGR00297 family protein [Candidatus Methanoperedens sp.]|nr:TIGR00297 family protein [Candidatus Methanoperedens sp.]
MMPTKEYEKQINYILLGLLVLFFPFFNENIFLLALLFFIAAIILSFVPANSSFFRFFARESDLKAGKLINMIQLFLTTGILLAISLLIGVDTAGVNKFPLFIIGAAFVITTFGDGVADIIHVIDKEKKQIVNNKQIRIKIYSAKSSIIFLISGSIFALFIGGWISGFTLYVPVGMLIFLSVIGALTGALLESMTKDEDNIIIPFGSAMVMWLFYMFGYNVDASYLMKVLVFSFFLGYLSYRAHVADVSAMLSATLLGVVIIISSGVNWFFMLLAFFLLGSVFTRYKYNFKLARGIAEGKGGIRGYKNVFSNSLAGLTLAIAYGIFPWHGQVLLAAYLGSVATACGDTLASEIGETYIGEPRMITTFKKVKPGTDGAVSILGETAAFLGSLAIALLAFILVSIDLSLVIIVTAGGFIGTNIDSLLGATLQQKGYLTNNGVNLVATISGAIVSGLLYSGLS